MQQGTSAFLLQLSRIHLHYAITTFSNCQHRVKILVHTHPQSGQQLSTLTRRLLTTPYSTGKTVSYSRSQECKAFVTRKSYWMRIRCFLSECTSILQNFDASTVQRLNMRQLIVAGVKPKRIDHVAPHYTKVWHQIMIAWYPEINMTLVVVTNRGVSGSLLRGGEVLLTKPIFMCSGTFHLEPLDQHVLTSHVPASYVTESHVPTSHFPRPRPTFSHSPYQG